MAIEIKTNLETIKDFVPSTLSTIYAFFETTVLIDVSTLNIKKLTSVNFRMSFNYWKS